MLMAISLAHLEDPENATAAYDQVVSHQNYDWRDDDFYKNCFEYPRLHG